VDARDDLRRDEQPQVGRDVVAARLHRRLDVGAVAVREPEREQPQQVLQRRTISGERG
jgi:hypothetical protein